MDSLISVLTLYKKGAITDYVLERALSTAMGRNIYFKISDDSKNRVAHSYCIFACPEKLVEGFVITYILDKSAIISYYSEEEFVEVLKRLKGQTQRILKLFNDFCKEKETREISFNYALGFLLSLYKEYRSELVVNDGEFLPDEVLLMDACDKFTAEVATNEDLEKILIEDVVCQPILEFAKKYMTVIKPEVTTELEKKFEEGRPTINANFDELVKFSTSTLGVRDHKEIPYNYTPTTNQ